MSKRLIGIGASYDVDINPALKASEKYVGDLSKGSSLTTIPIYRGDIGGVDNLKFMYPIGENQVPLVAYTILNAVDQDSNVRVTGNDEVKKLVDLMNGVLSTDISFISEGGDDEISLSNTIFKLFGQDAALENFFVTGDIPFAKEYTNSGYKGDVVLDLNTKRLLNGLRNTFRNFYNHGKLGNVREEFKEPNIYFFSGEGVPVIQELADSFYRNRKGGGLAHAIKEYALEKCSTDEEFKTRIQTRGFPIAYEYSKVRLQKMGLPFPVPSVNLKRSNKALSKLFELDWQFQLSHDDIFRMTDIDGLNNDWIVADGMARNIESVGKLDPRLIEVGKAIQTERKQFPLVDNFNLLIEEYIQQINSNLDEEYQIKTPSLEEFRRKYQEEEKGSIDELTEIALAQMK